MKHFKLLVFFIALCTAVLFSACPNSNLGPGNNDAITAVSIVGGATSLGWGASGSAPLYISMDSKGNNEFETTISLSADLLMFSCDVKPSWSGRWFLPPDNGTLDLTVTVTVDTAMDMVLSTGDGGENGARWRIPKAAKYTISLNTQTKKVTFTEVGPYEGGGGTDDVFTNMWLIDCKETAPLATAMTKVGDNWTITTPLVNNDYVKFNGEDAAPTVWGTPEEPDTSQRWFCPPGDGTPALDTLYFNYGADNSFAWKIVAAGTYTITLNPAAGTVTFQSDSVTQSSNLWLVKTVDPPIPTTNSFAMTETPAGSGVYTWEGVLQGWYKFCASDTAPVSYNSGIWYGPGSDSKAPAGVAENAGMGSDFAWQIPFGRYTITLTPGQQTVIIAPDPSGPGANDFEELWVIGIESMLYEGSNFWDAPNNTARRMTKSGDTFTWAYNFKNDYRHLRILCRDNGIIFYPNPAQLAPSRGDVQMQANQEYDIFTYDEAKALLESTGNSAAVASITNFSWQAVVGTNTITVNLSTKKIKCSAGGTAVDPGQGENAGGGGGGGGEEIVIDTTTVSNILLYGDGCATGWDTNPSAAGAIKLYTQSENVYAWKGPLSGGQLKFHNGTADIGASAYTSVPGIGGTFPVVSGSGNVWAISAAGTYVVRLDLNANQVSFIVQ